ncbi:MAG: indolepyruvate oxidoreductase subunit beta family protein [Pseudomonadota bacterium]
MTKHETIFVPQSEDSTRAITKLVVMAVGGQGGGVLTGWIEALCRAEGRAVQATSVAGVAQRTGATIYYVEIAPEGVTPIFSLAPAAGDVDIVIAAELMEAGRAIQRGFVTPDRTVLIGSTHRALAVSEKVVPGDGIAAGAEVIAAAEIAAERCLLADMDRLAVEQGSVISASLFGALAGSDALPFSRGAFEDAIKASGRGVNASLAAFAAGFDAAVQPTEETASQADSPVILPKPRGTASQMQAWAALQKRIAALPEPAQDMASAGLQKVVDFQDTDYGAAYLDHVEEFAAKDHGPYDLTAEAAKHVANAMAYDDVIRVADRKTRLARRGRVDGEIGVKPGQTLRLTEYFHPRAEEIAGLLPSRIGARVDASAKWMGRLDRWFGKGRRIRTDRLGGFIMLHLLSRLRGYRRRTLRHKIEQQHLLDWLSTVKRALDADYGLAVEMLRCRRLIKGYSDTHARGLSKFDRVLAGAALVAGRPDAADWVRRLRDAALQDEAGAALEGALKTIESFSECSASG